MGGTKPTPWSEPGADVREANWGQNSESGRRYNDDAASEPEAVNRVRTGTEEGQRDHVEGDDDRCSRIPGTQSGPDKCVQYQSDRRGNWRQIPCKQRHGQENCGALHPAGRMLSVATALQEQGYRDRRPQKQQTDAGPAWGKHGE